MSQHQGGKRKASQPWMKSILRQAELAGWGIKPTRKGWLLLAPDGKGAVTIHTSPSDHRAIHNIRGEFRRLGLEIR